VAERLETRDLIKMALSVVFGMSTVEFLKATGFVQELATNLGGSLSAAYLFLMTISGIILIWGW